MRLALDAGHGKFTAGKRCLRALDPNETREWVLNDRICRYLKELLNKYEIEVLRLDDITGNIDVPLIERSTKANNFKADFTLSIHHNAGAAGGSSGGITVHVYPEAGLTVRELQRDIYDILVKHTGLRGNRASPISENNFHMVREIDGYRSILIEHGFMDSKTDVPIILSEQFARNAAKAHEEFLVTTFNLKEKVNNMAITAGSKVKINAGAQYMTGGNVPATHINKEYTVKQLGHPWNVVGEGALIEEIVSWVWLKDLVLANPPVVPTPPATVLKTEYDKIVSELNKTKESLTNINNLLNLEKIKTADLNNLLNLEKSKVVNLTNEVNTLKAEALVLNNSIKKLTTEKDSVSLSLKHTTVLLGKAEAKITLLEETLNKTNEELSSCNLKINELTNQSQTFVTTIDDLNSTIIGLEERIDNYETQDIERLETIVSLRQEITVLKETSKLNLLDFSASDLFSAFIKKLFKRFKIDE